MCKKLGDDDISDVSLAGKFGFKTLKVIDLRFTGNFQIFTSRLCFNKHNNNY